tara:strand:- start:9 stop:491 length:483 start_codon:yes stop_codon:yes gene_type:complete
MSDKIPVPSGNEVYWEKWVDAYQIEMESTVNQLDQAEEEQILQELGLDEDALEALSSTTGESLFSNIKTIFTPFGILPLTEQSLASSHFKFWVGHTNFKIPKSFHNIIANVKGVEAFDIFTPYRFRIAIGKLFQDRNVMAQVRGHMLTYVNNKEGSEGRG